MGSSDWESERRLCRAAQARQIVMPEDGGESERVNVVEVMERRSYFPAAGVFVLWEGETAVYVAATTQPLGVRLRMSVANRGLWTRDERFPSLTVSMRRGTQQDALRLRHELKPKFNRRGYAVDDVRKNVADWLDGESKRLSLDGDASAAEAVNRVRARLLGE